jgi:N utilization substance protein B
MTESAMRRARYLVIETLYEADTSGHAPLDVYERRVAEASADDPELLLPGPNGFGRGAVRGVTRLREELDEYIAGAASQFPLDTMAVVDRNILRLAIWELLTDRAAPVAAVVNEAVELAHRYGGESTPGFVNGVLRTVSERIQATRGAGGAREGALPANSHSQEI